MLGQGRRGGKGETGAAEHAPDSLSERVHRTVRRSDSELPAVLHPHTPCTGEHPAFLRIGFVQICYVTWPLHTSQHFLPPKQLGSALTLEGSLARVDQLKDAAFLCYSLGTGHLT